MGAIGTENGVNGNRMGLGSLRARHPVPHLITVDGNATSYWDLYTTTKNRKMYSKYKRVEVKELHSQEPLCRCIVPGG
jgi:hypothetical protein